MIRAVGFDLGETLFTFADTPLSWTPLYGPALARVAVACGLQPDEKSAAAAAAILARHNTRLHPRTTEVGADFIFAEILAAWGQPHPAPQLSDAIAAFFGFFQQRLVAYHESVAVMKCLRDQGLRLGALTDVPYGMPRTLVEQDLASCGLWPQLDRLFTSVDVAARKPAPEGFHALARALGVTPPELCYVGNEEKDIRGALAAGAVAVLVDRENRRPSWGQRHTIPDLRALPAALELTARPPAFG